jgi:hypothetical protein
MITSAKCLSRGQGAAVSGPSGRFVGLAPCGPECGERWHS